MIQMINEEIGSHIETVNKTREMLQSYIYTACIITNEALHRGNKLVTQLKKERLLQIERITKLQSKIDSLIVKTELQEKQLLAKVL